MEIGTGVIGVSLFHWQFVAYSRFFIGRNFERTPFALTDAHDACLFEVKSKLGERLLRSEMVPLSTRFNQVQ